MPSWDKNTTNTLTSDGSGDSLGLRVHGPSDIAVEYVLACTNGTRHGTPGDGTFNLAAVAISAASQAAIGAHLTAQLGVVSPTNEQIAALHALIVMRQRIDIRSHAATLAGFAYTP